MKTTNTTYKTKEYNLGNNIIVAAIEFKDHFAVIINKNSDITNIIKNVNKMTIEKFEEVMGKLNINNMQKAINFVKELKEKKQTPMMSNLTSEQRKIIDFIGDYAGTIKVELENDKSNWIGIADGKRIAGFVNNFKIINNKKLFAVPNDDRTFVINRGTERKFYSIVNNALVEKI